jgi:hypothetical protein
MLAKLTSNSFLDNLKKKNIFRVATMLNPEMEDWLAGECPKDPPIYEDVRKEGSEPEMVSLQSVRQFLRLSKSD